MRNLAKYLFVALVGFFAGNSTPTLTIWLFGANKPVQERWRAEKDAGTKASQPSKDSATELTAKWNTVREKTRQEILVAERILAMMQQNAIPDVDIRAQTVKVDELRKRLVHCELRLREVAEQRAELVSGPPGRDEVNLDELDIHHRHVIEQGRLKKIGVAP